MAQKLKIPAVSACPGLDEQRSDRTRELRLREAKGFSMRYCVVWVALFTALFGGCATIGAVRPLSSNCSESHLVADKEINLEPIQVKTFYQQLEKVTRGVPFRELTRMRAGTFELPMVLVGPLGDEGGRRVVVVAGVHGGEVAATLGGLSVVADIRRDPDSWAGAEIYVVIPANPIGFAVQSRWNGQGCDIERDFGSFQTPEAQAIGAVIDWLDPQLVIDLHESDRDGVAIFATERVPATLLDSVLYELGQSVQKPGMPEPEGKHGGWAAGGRLVDYAQEHGAGGIRTDTPWRHPDLRNRLHAQVVATRVAVQALVRLSSDLR